jgi:hypothetical protein
VQVVSFKQRYMAESFVSEVQAVLGRVELAWFTDAAAVAAMSAGAGGAGGADGGAAAEEEEGEDRKKGDVDVKQQPPSSPAGDLTMPDVSGGEAAGGGVYKQEADQGDLDVADDDQDEDRWMK